MANRWLDEEICLALELYLRKGKSKWINTINDETKEIIVLSKLLKGMDFALNSNEPSYRSTGSIRLKLANLTSIDPDYKHAGMGNASKGDKKIWKRYEGRYNELALVCKTVISEHYCGRFDSDIKEYVLSIGNIRDVSSEDFYDYCDEVKENIIRIRKNLIVNENSLETQKAVDDSYRLIRFLNEMIGGKDNTKEQFIIHAGVNMLPVGSDREKNLVTTKIGKHVRDTFFELIEHNKISEQMITQLLDADYSKRTFRINHPFLVKIDTSKNIFDQMRDENKYIRYYTKTVEINNSTYGLCKEWFERQRKYYDSWLNTIDDKSTPSRKIQLLKYLLEKDREKTFIDINAITKEFSDIQAIDLVLDELIEMKVLCFFNGDKKKVYVEDYEQLYNLVNNPEYVRKRFG